MGGGGLFTIIILIAVVWQIISAIVQHSQQQKQRQAEMQARQQRSTTRTAETQTGQVSVGQTSKQSRLDELAARRQQQLEELRRRRDAERQSSTQATSRSQPSSPSSSSSSSSRSTWQTGAASRTSGTGQAMHLPKTSEGRTAPTAGRSSRQSPGESQREVTRGQDRARQQQTQAHQLAKAEVYTRQQEEQRLSDLDQDRQRSDAAAGLAALEEAALARTNLAGEANRELRIRSLMGSPSALRDVIVMNELLSPPLALREMHQF